MGLVVYFLLSLYLGRRNPMFYLIIIFALQQGQAAFIDQSISVGGKKIFSAYDRTSMDTLFVGTALIGLFLIRYSLPKSESRLSKVIFAMLIYYLALLFIDLVSYIDTNDVLLTGRQLLYIPLSYFLWLAIFHSVKRSDYEDFLKLMFYVTPISGILYILNSSQVINIFDKSLIFQDIEFGSSSFFRDFRTIPIYLTPILVLAIQAILIPIIKIPRWLLNTNLIILPIALLFTFTRSIFVGVAIQVIMILIIYYLSNPFKSLKRLITFISLFFALAIPLYMLADKFYPDQMKFLFGRFNAASTEGVHEQNVDIRLAYLDKAIEVTNKTNPIIGVGMNKSHYKELDDVGSWTVDSTIPFFLYHTGWLGVAFLYIIILYCFLDSVFLFIKTKDWLVVYLCSVFASTFIASLLAGGGMLTGSVWALMNTALYVTVKFNLWKNEAVVVKKLA